MPRNGSGNYSLPQSPFVAGTVISSVAVNSDLSDIASALTASLARDGQSGMTGQLKGVDGSVAAPSFSWDNEEDTGFWRKAAGEIGVTILGVEIGTFDANGATFPVTGTIPVGTITDFAGAAAPTAWLFCYGQNVSRTTYASLFALIGTTYGSGDGITTFGLPDLRGTITPGKDDMGGVAASRLTTAFYGTDPTVLGNRGGAQSKVLLSANLPAYTPAGVITNGAITIGGQTSLRNVAGGGDNNNNGGGGGAFSAMSSTAPTLTGSQASSTFAGTAQGGTSTAFSEIQPSLIMNKIIYAGV